MKTRNTRGFHVSSSATTARSFDLALVAPQTTMVMTLISSLNMTSHSEATTCGSSFVLDDYPIVSSDKLIKYFKLRQRSLTELSYKKRSRRKQTYISFYRHDIEIQLILQSPYMKQVFTQTRTKSRRPSVPWSSRVRLSGLRWPR